MKTIRIVRNIIFLGVAIAIAGLPAAIMAHGIDVRSYSDDERPDKAGVLVVALVPGDVQTASKQELMDKRIKEAFPGMEVRWSFFDVGSETADAFISGDKRVSSLDRAIAGQVPFEIIESRTSVAGP